MRLHSVRFKELPQVTDRLEARDARADFVRDLMTLHGCYLQKCYDSDRDCLVWMARYE